MEAQVAGLNRSYDRRPARPELRLSARQAEILARVGCGMSDREIASDLGCSYRTVRTHLERLFAANGFHSRAAAAVAWAVKGSD